MNKTLTTLICLSLSPWAHAGLIFHPSELNLGTLSTAATVHSEAWVLNTSEETLSLQDLEFSIADFSAAPLNEDLAAGDSLLIEFDFQPTQNTLRQGILVAQSSEGAAMLEVTATGDYPGTEWDATAGLEGQELFDVLHNLVIGNTVLSYTTARTHMFSTIDNVDGWVEGVYTGLQIQTSGIPDHTVMNTEHTWPQSMFGDDDNARTDLHHLFPTSSPVNSSRGNLPFGDVVVPGSGWPQGGSSRGTDENGTTVFEPRDEHKGDCARAMFYFALHYGNPNNFLSYQDATLRQWSFEDLVSDKERDRNDGIENVQGNRNPLIDQPGLVERMGSFSGNADLPNVSNLQIWPASLDLGLEFDAAEANATIVIHNGGRSAVSLWSLQAEPDLLEFSEFPSTLAAGESALLALQLSAAAPAGVHEIEISFRSTAGNRSLMLNVELQSTAVEHSLSTVPAAVTLLPAWPNPFNPLTHLGFELSTASSVEARIFDLRGAQIEYWPSRLYAAGSHELQWNAAGQPSGVYFFQMISGGVQQNEKLLLLK